MEEVLAIKVVAFRIIGIDVRWSGLIILAITSLTEKKYAGFQQIIKISKCVFLICFNFS